MRAPPWWIRGLLILTCGGVSFAHGSNDGQKGMGLIMLILIGTVPMAYALNRAMPAAQMTPFVAMAQATQRSLERYSTARRAGGSARGTHHLCTHPHLGRPGGAGARRHHRQDRRADQDARQPRAGAGGGGHRTCATTCT